MNHRTKPSLVTCSCVHTLEWCTNFRGLTWGNCINFYSSLKWLLTKSITDFGLKLLNVSRLGCPSKTLGSIPLGRYIYHTILLVDSLLMCTDCDMNVHVSAQRQIPSHMHSFQDEVEAANDATFFCTSPRQTGNNKFRN